MYNETYLFLALFSALLVYLLDYSFGQPGNEKWNSQELLSGWSFLLAKRRLKRDGAWQGKHQQLLNQLKEAKTPYDEKMIYKSFRQAVFAQARETFYWEKAAGMCPICFHFWITLITFIAVNIFYFEVNIFTFILYCLVSHLFIRILKKFI